MSDAVDIMNEFTNFNPLKGEEPLPLPIPGHWFRKICALADRIVAAEARAEAAEAQVAALQAALEEEGHRNAVFTACLHKAQNLYLEAHPDYPGWPDGAVNITWVLEAFDKERAEVKRLQTALAAANEDAGYLADAAEMLMQKWGSDDVVMFDFARISAVIEHYRARVGAS